MLSLGWFGPARIGSALGSLWLKTESLSTCIETLGASARGVSNAHSFYREEYDGDVVPTTHRTKLLRPKADPHLQAAGERVKAAAEELERLRIADGAGKRVYTDLPTDMRDGVDRDFGG
jgi:hypothetical protein